MQKASASIRYICMIYVANASIAIRSLTSEMKPGCLFVFLFLDSVNVIFAKYSIRFIIILYIPKLCHSIGSINCTFD